MTGKEHWTTKGDVRLFIWRKAAPEVRETGATVN